MQMQLLCRDAAIACMHRRRSSEGAPVTIHPDVFKSGQLPGRGGTGHVTIQQGFVKGVRSILWRALV